MSADEFWHGDPNLCKSYRLADEYRKEQRNYELWLQGLYNYRALSASLDAFGKGLSGKKGGKSLEYLEYPIAITRREKEAELERKKQRTIKWFMSEGKDGNN